MSVSINIKRFIRDIYKKFWIPLITLQVTLPKDSYNESAWMTNARNAQINALFGAKVQKKEVHECNYIISFVKTITQNLDNFME